MVSFSQRHSLHFLTLPSLTPTIDRIPIPQLCHSQNFRLTTPAERQSVYRNEFCNPKVKERLAVLLDPSRLSEMYAHTPYLVYV